MIQILSVAAAVGCGVVAGVFFAFSSFVMSGLARAAPPAGLRAMQGINVAAIRPPLMIALFGTAVLSVAAAIASVVAWLATGPGAAIPWAVGGAAVYIVTAIVMTVVYHVPRNNALAVVSEDEPDAAERFDAYRIQWTRANHVRAIGSAAACVSFIIAALLA